MCSEHWTRRGCPSGRSGRSSRQQMFISVQEAARLVMEGVEEIGTQWIEVDRNEKVRVESEQAGEAKHVPMNLKSRLVALGN